MGKRGPLAGIAIEDRFWPYVEKTDGCWLWTGRKNRDGYGYVSIDSKPVGAHRIAYSLNVGAIPDGLFVLHRCDTPPCVNPSHLFLGTNTDNMRDASGKGRLVGFTRKDGGFCPRGHAMTSENTYRRPKSGKRTCRECDRAACRRWKERH